MSRLSTNIFLIFIILRVEKSSCDKSTDIHIYPYNIKHRIENVLWTVLSIDPWERCSNTEPYTHIRRHLHSVSLIFFLFLRAPEREREREVRFYPESIAYPIPIPAFQVRRISAERTATLHFAVQSREVWTFSDRKHQSSPPLFRKSDASRGRSFEGIDKHWTRYTGCPKSNARFEL